MRILKWTGLGCLGLTGLMVGLVVVVAMIGAISGPTPTPKAKNHAHKEPAEAPAHKEPAQEPAPKPEEPQGPEDRVELSGTATGASCAIEDGKNSRTVDTEIPGMIPLEVGWTDYAAANCQKSGAAGSMKVELYVDGSVEASGSTSAEYGLVMVTYPQ